MNSIKDIIKEIESNHIIRIGKGTYCIENINIINDKVKYEDVYDGYELIIEDVENLIIEGDETNLTELLSKFSYANVITFNNCCNITLKNLVFGHTVENKGYCVGGVLKFNSCKNVKIYGCTCFGCGTEGFTLNNCSDFFVENTDVKECTYGIMSISDSKDIKFSNCKFYNNREFDLINLLSSQNISLDSCEIYENYTDDFGYSIFKVILCNEISFKNGTIKNNSSGYLCNNESNIDFFNSYIEDNKYYNDKFENEFIFRDYDAELIYFNNDPNSKHKILYIEQEGIKISKGEIEKYVNRDLPSKPDLLDDKLIYTSPFGFEAIGDIYLYDINLDKEKIVLKSLDMGNKQKTIKKVFWKNKDSILFIYGNAFGTVTQGGNLYEYSILDKIFKLIYENNNNEEVSDVIFTESRDEFLIEITKYDDEMNRYTKVFRKINII
ncbi:hypothetical protein CLOACE_18530 [Clostridium acetireducens DSM 10703]|uniref:Right handed beta helix domain-containing protein n=1 Tax=Clostridium acetireducens DSM 10703 TaxID=1121290 RepID=A0A1E8EX01_9CLOT|nr:DUF4652 domain-containing protein [Clostridium acetireducens]OFI05285.1 hypothetical protein CLOACE_18530 [Clostridium acetireducens DSM 10703]